MYLFYNVEPEEFLFFMRNFNMTLAASGTLEAGAKIQDLHTIFRREALRQFDLLYADLEIKQHLNIDDIIKVLAQ